MAHRQLVIGNMSAARSGGLLRRRGGAHRAGLCRPARADGRREGSALASISHPDPREELLRYVHDDPRYTRPVAFIPGQPPHGVYPYKQ
jgi:hypothetical protein